MVADLLVVRWYQVSSRYKLREARQRLLSADAACAPTPTSPAFKVANP
jgi:hypothetical protein